MSAIVGVVAALDTTYLSAARATAPRLLENAGVDRRDLAPVNAMLVMQWNTVQVVAPPVVVWLLASTDPAPVLLVAAIALLVAFAALGPYARAAVAATVTATEEATESSFLARLSAGFGAVVSDPVARSVVVVSDPGEGLPSDEGRADVRVVDRRIDELGHALPADFAAEMTSALGLVLAAA